MIPEEQLKDAALEADRLLMAAVPETESCDHEFSPVFEKKMRKLIRRRKYPVLTHPVFRAAAMFLVVMLLGGTVLLSVPEVRASFKGLFFEEQEHKYRYVLTGCVEEDDMRTYHLGWVPEGYVLTNENNRDSGRTIIYRDSERGMIRFSYNIQREEQDILLYHSFESLECRWVETTVNGRSADLFELRGSDGKVFYSVIWMNEERSILFAVGGARTEEEAVRMAQSVISREPEE